MCIPPFFIAPPEFSAIVVRRYQIQMKSERRDTRARGFYAEGGRVGP